MRMDVLCVMEMVLELRLGNAPGSFSAIVSAGDMYAHVHLRAVIAWLQEALLLLLLLLLGVAVVGLGLCRPFLILRVWMQERKRDETELVKQENDDGGDDADEAVGGRAIASISATWS